MIRELLLRVEADRRTDGGDYVVYDASDFPGHTQTEVAYHIDQLMEMGLVKGEAGNRDAPTASVSRLTSDGHELLSEIRDPEIWERVKEQTRDLPGVSVAAILAVAKTEVRKKLGLP